MIFSENIACFTLFRGGKTTILSMCVLHPKVSYESPVQGFVSETFIFHLNLSIQCPCLFWQNPTNLNPVRQMTSVTIISPPIK